VVELAGAAREEMCVEASWEQIYANRKLEAYDFLNDEQ
jgi:hypothetical protein